MSAPQPDQINVLLFGLGAIGGFYAYILGQNKNVSLSVIARSNYEAVKTKRLKIESSIHGNQTATIDHVYKYVADIPHTTTFDYIVCAHKAINPSSTPPLFQRITTANTTFVIIQNGVGNEDPFRETYPSNTIISCVTWTGAVQHSPGTITHNTNENLHLGLFPNPPLHNPDLESQRLQDFAALLSQGGTKFSIEHDVQIRRWEKVVWNTAWNPLTTLTGVPVQTWLESSPEAEACTLQLMNEVIAVGRAFGVPLRAEGLPEELVAKVQAMGTPIWSSMYQDAVAGRALEWEVIVGFPMRKAVELGLEVPVLRAVYALMRAVDGRLTGVKCP